MLFGDKPISLDLPTDWEFRVVGEGDEFLYFAESNSSWGTTQTDLRFPPDNTGSISYWGGADPSANNVEYPNWFADWIPDEAEIVTEPRFITISGFDRAMVINYEWSGGTSSARMYGLQNDSGTIIVIVNTDDSGFLTRLEDTIAMG